MKKILLSIFAIVAFSTAAFSRTSAPPSTFVKHSYEVQVTPSADYLIWRNGDALKDDPYETRGPFIGFAFGFNYIFRPIKLVGVSAGINMKMQGGFTRVRTYPLFQSSYISMKGNHHVSFISIPIQAHLYKEMSDCTFEFAIGPEFNIPVFNRSSATLFAPDGEKVSTNKETGKYSTTQMREGASFGLSILLGGEMHLCDHANLFVGPQIQFLDLVRFDKDLTDWEKTNGRFYDVSLGIKLGFRFH